jgi:hypothetical protein
MIEAVRVAIAQKTGMEYWRVVINCAFFLGRICVSI